MVVSYRKISEGQFELDVTGSSSVEDEQMLREVLRPLLCLRPGEVLHLTLNGSRIEKELMLLGPSLPPSS